MRDEDNNNNIGASTPSSVQRAVPFGDGGNDSNINNEVVDNNYNNDDNIPTTVSENNDISVDEEVGSNVNRYEHTTLTIYQDRGYVQSTTQLVEISFQENLT